MQTADELFRDLRAALSKIAEDRNLLDETVTVTGKTLSVVEAIGNPQRQDFPLIKGKEKLMQATFKGASGQAFTDMPASFTGSLSEILNMPLSTHFEMAVFVATMNAVLRHLEMADKTIHCHDDEPEECAKRLVDWLNANYQARRVALVGFQPSFLEALAPEFDVRVLDLDPDRVGTVKFGVMVEDGEASLGDVLEWADVLMVTGSTLANGTVVDFIGTGKPVVFYGTTIAGAACICGLTRFCECAR